jgi:DNA polymerase/3'-5' exonuclease PolX
MQHELALNIALRYYKDLKPMCTQIKIGGSLRRQKPEVKDIEIICAPKQTAVTSDGLFETIHQLQPLPEFVEYVNAMERVKGNALGKYTQINLPEGIKLDLFIANENNFGLILLIRTGSDTYCKNIMRELLRRGFRCEDGNLIKNKKIIPVKLEKDFYTITGIQYTEPKERWL